MLSDGDNVRRGVGNNHAIAGQKRCVICTDTDIDLPREDGSVNDVNVVGAVDLCVGVNDRGTTSKTAVSADLGSADPVVCSAGSWSLRELHDS